MCLAIPGRVISIDSPDDPALRTASVDFGGVRKDISLAFTPEANPGDYVLVHVGFALSVVNESEARKILDELARLDEFSREFDDTGPDAAPPSPKTGAGT